MGTQTPPEKGGGALPPQFSAHDYYGQVAEGIKMVLGVELGLSPGDFVLNGNPAPLPKKWTEPPPKFSAHFYCGQTAGCINMPLGMEVGVSPVDFALDGDPVPLPQKGGGAPNIPPMFIVAKRLDGSRWYLA